MTEYLVTWQIEIDANTPEQAAKKARAIQVDPDNQADHFEVTNEEGVTVEVSALQD
jgi:hypothetical protein